MKTNELIKEFGIDRSAFMARLAELRKHGFELTKNDRNHIDATDEEVEVLRDFDRHLKDGGTYKSFVMPSSVTVVSPQDTSQDIVQDSPRDTTQDTAGQLAEKANGNGHFAPQDYPLDTLTDMASLADAIAKRIEPLSHHRNLIWAADNKLLLTTKEVRSLIGVRPSGEKFDRGSYRFLRSGKIGAQSAWLVKKLEVENENY